MSSWENLARTIDNRVLIRSRDRKTGTPTAAFFQLGKTYSSVSQIELLHFSMSNTIYNVRDFLMLVRIGATTYSVTLPPGNYTAPTFFTILQNAITTATGTAFTITVDPLTQRLTISAGVAFDLLLSTAPGHVTVLIGYDRVDYTGATSYLAPRVYSLSQPDHLVVRIPGICATRLYGTQNVSGAFVVPVSVNFGSQIIFDSQSNFPQILELINPEGISHFAIEIVDDFNRTLTNIADDWSLVLRITEDGTRKSL